jgi:hypothetical protein
MSAQRYSQWCYATHRHRLSGADDGELVAYADYAVLERQLAKAQADLKKMRAAFETSSTSEEKTSSRSRAHAASGGCGKRRNTRR